MFKKIAKYSFSIVIFVSITILLFINMSPQFGANPTSKEKRYFNTFPNYQKGEFKSLEQTPVMTGDVSAWEFFKNVENKNPKTDIIPKKIDYFSFKDLNNEDYKISWLGHSAFIINLNHKIILLDPMLGSHAAPLPLPNLKRYNSTLPIDPELIENIDLVIISHDHYDHLDYYTIKKIKNNVKTFLVPHGVGNHLRSWGIDVDSIVELNWNQNFTIDGIEFVCLPARHFSGRGPLNRNSTLWSSWAIKSSNLKIYFSGDSGYGTHFKKIGEDHGPFDISLIDCGQYNKAWKYSHMFPHEAVKAARDLKTEFFIPIHWGAFTLAMHSWDEPVVESIRWSKETGLKCLTPEIGDQLSKERLNEQFTEWWEKY